MKKDKLDKIQQLQNSSDAGDKLVADYHYLSERISEKVSFLDLLRKGKLDPMPKTPKVIFETELAYMRAYAQILEARAECEGINLELK